MSTGWHIGKPAKEKRGLCERISRPRRRCPKEAVLVLAWCSWGVASLDQPCAGPSPPSWRPTMPAFLLHAVPSKRAVDRHWCRNARSAQEPASRACLKASTRPGHPGKVRAFYSVNMSPSGASEDGGSNAAKPAGGEVDSSAANGKGQPAPMNPLMRRAMQIRGLSQLAAGEQTLNRSTPMQGAAATASSPSADKSAFKSKQKAGGKGAPRGRPPRAPKPISEQRGMRGTVMEEQEWMRMRTGKISAGAPDDSSRTSFSRQSVSSSSDAAESSWSLKEIQQDIPEW